MIKLKKWTITFLMYIIAFSVSAGIVYYENKNVVKDDFAIAGNTNGSSPTRLDDNVSGFAWSSNFGWISFNSADCDVDGNGVFTGIPAGCPPVGTAFYDYGVNINGSGDFLRSDNSPSYAWSTNLGWIDFSGVKFDSITGDVTGTSTILSLGATDGKLVMSGTWSNGVQITNTDFEGYAWNGNSDGSGLGWLSFNCNTGGPTGNDICAISNYKVSAYIVPNAPTVGTISEVPGCPKTVVVNWTDNSFNESGFEVEASTSPMSAVQSGIKICSVAPNVTTCTYSALPSTAYYFRVRATSPNGNSGWAPDDIGKDFITTICPPTLNTPLIADYNCDRVNLSWDQLGSGVSYYDIFRNGTGIDPWGTAIASTTATSTVDTDIVSGEKYYYKVTARPQNLDSNIVGPINPCANLPTWRETKAK